MSLKETIQSIQPIQPKTDRKIPIFGREITPMDLLRESIRISTENGWSFGAGDPEFWKFSRALIIPGGKALDLGSRLGRTSMPFALQGMEVTAYETDPVFVNAMGEFAKNFNLPVSVLDEDVRTADFGIGIYDTVILGQTFKHFESREEAFRVIDRAIDAVKPEGHIWFRVNGKGDPKDNSSEETYIDSCDCTGKTEMEPHLFFDPLGFVNHLSKRGIKVVHAQMVPERGKVNIMYGENWGTPRDEFDDRVSFADLINGGLVDQKRVFRGDDMITIMGQKRKPIRTVISFSKNGTAASVHR